jgi:hypothetical protein
MDPLFTGKIVSDITAILLPLLPYLIKGAKAAGEEFAEAAGKGAGKKVLTLAESLWQKLKPGIDKTPHAQETIDQVLERPNDPQTIQALRGLIKEALIDPQVKKEMQALLRKDKQEPGMIKAALRIGRLYGKAIGVEITNLEALKAAKVVANIQVDTVGKGGKVTGVIIGANSPHLAGDETTDAPPLKR